MRKGGKRNIPIHHAFQNAKRSRKWYWTVLLLYFLRVLLLPSDLHFAFYVFWCFLTFSDCVTIVFCLISGQCPFLTKNCQYQSTVLRTDFKQTKMLIVFSGGWKPNTIGTLRNSPQNRKCMRKGGDMAQRHNYTPCISKHQTNQEMILNSIIAIALYFLPVHILLLSSCLPFAFCVFLMLFDIFWFRYNCILSVLWPMPISDHKVVNITVLKDFSNRRIFFLEVGNEYFTNGTLRNNPQNWKCMRKGGDMEHTYTPCISKHQTNQEMILNSIAFVFRCFLCFLMFFDIFWLCYYCVLLFSVQCPFLPKKCQYQSTDWRTDFKQTKMLIFFWRLEIKH